MINCVTVEGKYESHIKREQEIGRCAFMTSKREEKRSDVEEYHRADPGFKNVPKCRSCDYRLIT